MLLKTGPSPVWGVSGDEKLAWPATNRACKAGLSPANGSPKVGLPPPDPSANTTNNTTPTPRRAAEIGLRTLIILTIAFMSAVLVRWIGRCSIPFCASVNELFNR